MLFVLLFVALLCLLAGAILGFLLAVLVQSQQSGKTFSATLSADDKTLINSLGSDLASLKTQFETWLHLGAPSASTPSIATLTSPAAPVTKLVGSAVKSEAAPSAPISGT